MTYGVPYSFVPGTKAKADEVNANFIDVLNKIEETNTKLTDTNIQFSQRFDDEVEALNTQVKELGDSRLDLSLSNISAEGQKLFDAKANTSQLDGNWITTNLLLANEKSITPGETQNLSLKGLLPDDTNLYMCILDGYMQVASSLFMYLLIDKTPNVCALRTSTSKFGTLNVVIITGSARNIQVYSQPGSSGTSKYTLNIRGYRRIR